MMRGIDSIGVRRKTQITHRLSTAVAVVTITASLLVAWDARNTLGMTPESARHLLRPNGNASEEDRRAATVVLLRDALKSAEQLRSLRDAGDEQAALALLHLHDATR